MQFPSSPSDHAHLSEGSDAVICVGPVEGGWCVSCGALAEPLMFLSGGRAETQARALAEVLAGLGQDAVIEIHDRRNDLAGAVRYLAEPRPQDV